MRWLASLGNLRCGTLCATNCVYGTLTTVKYAVRYIFLYICFLHFLFSRFFRSKTLLFAQEKYFFCKFFFSLSFTFVCRWKGVGRLLFFYTRFDGNKSCQSKSIDVTLITPLTTALKMSLPQGRHESTREHHVQHLQTQHIEDVMVADCGTLTRTMVLLIARHECTVYCVFFLPFMVNKVYHMIYKRDRIFSV